MDLDLKTLGGTYWTLDWFYDNQAVMLVEKFENLVMDSCSDGWNVQDCKANQVQIFGVNEIFNIGDGWNVQNWLIYCKLWMLIIQNLRCRGSKNINF